MIAAIPENRLSGISRPANTRQVELPPKNTPIYIPNTLHHNKPNNGGGNSAALRASPLTLGKKMNILTHVEKQKLERELNMGSGYVLNFSNRTFEEFFREVVRVQIFDSRYDLHSGSKANRVRAFWQIATEEQLKLFFGGLMEAWEIYANATIPESAKTLIAKILVRLGGYVPETGYEKDNTKDSKFTIGENISKKLGAQLLEVTSLPPQRRGYEFERFLRELFDAYGMSARASFRITGEQIDGSFVLHNETYLLEAKWQNAPTGAADLHTFEGKLGEKASWSRGLFVSNSGFTPEGLTAFGRGKRLICMDGFDLFEMLRLQLSVVDVLAAKTRRAAETGSPYMSVRALFA